MEVQNNVVTLRGSVGNIPEMREIENLIKNLPHIKDVKNQLTLKARDII